MAIALVALAHSVNALDDSRYESCRDRNELRVVIAQVIDGAVDAGRSSNDPEYARRFEAVAATVSDALEKQPY